MCNRLETNYLTSIVGNHWATGPLLWTLTQPGRLYLRSFVWLAHGWHASFRTLCWAKLQWFRQIKKKIYKVFFVVAHTKIIFLLMKYYKQGLMGKPFPMQLLQLTKYTKSANLTQMIMILFPDIKNALILCNLVYFMTGSNISTYLGLAALSIHFMDTSSR